MAIRKSFNGASILKPGAYSRSKVSKAGGSPLSAPATVMLIGEASSGPGFADEGIQSFDASAASQIFAIYRSGPLVDAARAALAPSRTPGINGASRILVAKTNPSSRASLALALSFGTLFSSEYGVDANRVTAKNDLVAEGAAAVTGTAAISNFVGLNTQTLIVRMNGGASETVTFSSPANITDVISQINAGLTAVLVTASQDAGKLVLTLDAAANHHRDGFGRSFEIVGTSTALSNLFLSAGIVLPASEPQAVLTVAQPRDGVTQKGTVGGAIALELGRDSTGSVTAATVAVSATQLTLVETGGSTFNLLFSQYPTLKDLSDAVAALPGWSVKVGTGLRAAPSSSLDQVSAQGAFAEVATRRPARIKRDAAAYQELIENSIDLASIVRTAVKGLPDVLLQTNLSGAVRGASSSAAFQSALDAALAFDPNVIVPCVSQDASSDIALGLTDSGSTYDVEAIHAQLDAHLRLRGNTQNRKEAQGVVGYRKQAKADVYAQAGTVGSELVQLCAQDVLVVDSTGDLAWKQPHVFAALIAGIRTGAPVGTPATFKYLAVSGVGHFVNSATGKSQGDFDPGLHYNEAIEAGVTFSEPATGGHRVVVDNTTYGADSSFIFNRGSVVQAAQYAARQIREDAELTFVGNRGSDVSAESIKNRVRAKASQLWRDGVLDSSDDAPQGFVEDSFVVVKQGNTATVELEIKPTEGLDFIFITFTLGQSTQTA